MRWNTTTRKQAPTAQFVFAFCRQTLEFLTNFVFRLCRFSIDKNVPEFSAWENLNRMSSVNIFQGFLAPAFVFTTHCDVRQKSLSIRHTRQTSFHVNGDLDIASAEFNRIESNFRVHKTFIFNKVACCENLSTSWKIDYVTEFSPPQFAGEFVILFRPIFWVGLDSISFLEPYFMLKPREVNK